MSADGPGFGSQALLERYLIPLRAHANATSETALGHAYDLGRAALAQRQGLLDIVVMHHTALGLALACDGCRDERTRTLRAGGDLLAEMLSPFDMAQRAFLEVHAALRSSNELLEQEAHRVARLLHDSAGQIVFALQLAMADFERELPQSLRPRLKELSLLLQQLDQQLRWHSQELYPVMLADLGLAAAVGDLINRMRARTGLAIVFSCSLTERLAADVESAVYRAVQEALTNAVRHAHATEANVTLSVVGPMLTCSIADNGVGFMPRPVGDPGPGLGLVGIRDRMKSVNGTVHIRSARGHGTQIILGVPLPAEERTKWD